MIFTIGFLLALFCGPVAAVLYERNMYRHSALSRVLTGICIIGVLMMLWSGLILTWRYMP